MALTSFESLTTTALFISIAFLVLRLLPTVWALVQHYTQADADGSINNVFVDLYEWYTQKLSLPWQLILAFMAFNVAVGVLGLDGRDATAHKPMGWMVQAEQDKQAFIKQHVDPLGHNKDNTKADDTKEKAQ